MNEKQEKEFQHVNDNWPVDRWQEEPDDQGLTGSIIHFFCDDGSDGYIYQDGTLDWT